MCQGIGNRESPGSNLNKGSLLLHMGFSLCGGLLGGPCNLGITCMEAILHAGWRLSSVAALGSCSLLPVSPHLSSVTKLDTLVIPGLNSKGNISWIVSGSKEEGMDMFYVYLGTMQKPMCGKLGWQLLDTIIERRLDHEGSDLTSGPIHQDS